MAFVRNPSSWFVVFALLVASNVAQATPAQPPDERSAKNSVYVEGLGPGLIYSLDYERVLGAAAARVGAGTVLGREVHAGGSSGGVVPLLVAVPLTLSYVGRSRDWDMIEAGAGAVVLYAAAHVSTIYVKERPTASTTVFGTALIGYRYQPPDGGVLFRIGASMIVGRDGFFPLWPYASLGVTF